MTIPHNITRLDRIQDAFEAGWSKIPVYYHYAFQVQLPMTDAEFERLFVKNFRLFMLDLQQEMCPGIVTNADFSSFIASEPFLLMGIGVLAMGEGLSFCQRGRLLPQSVLDASIGADQAAPIRSDCAVLPPGSGPAPPGTEAPPATLWYGGPTWRLIDKFFQMKRFSLRVGRCEIVNESLFELGMVYTPPQFLGAGDSCVPTTPFIRETNDVLAGKNFNRQFLTTDTEQVQIVGADGALIDWLGHCAPNAEVVYGHPVVANLANRIYCLPQPLMITPFMSRIDMEFETIDNDCCLIPAARKAATLSCETQVEGWPALNAFNLPTEVCTVPGGCLTIGIVLKGYTCLPQVVAQYLCDYMPQGLESIYSSNRYVAGVIDQHKLHQHPNLRGIVSGLQKA